MDRFMLDGNIVKVYRHVIHSSEDGVTIDTSAAMPEQLAAIKARLDENEIPYTVEPLDNTSLDWLDGRKFEGYKEVYDAISMGEEEYTKHLIDNDPLSANDAITLNHEMRLIMLELGV